MLLNHILSSGASAYAMQIELCYLHQIPIIISKHAVVRASSLDFKAYVSSSSFCFVY